MKSKQFAEGRHSLRGTVLGAGVALLVPWTAWAGSDSEKEPIEEPEPEEEPVFDNWVDFSVGGMSVDGSEAAFKRRFGGPDGDFYGGIEDFHFEKMTDSGMFRLDGHAMFGLSDYELKLRYDWDDLGYVEGGYREFRTWYDGSGGYAGPGVTNDWIEAPDEVLELDRGELWFEAGLRMPDIPQFTFRYSHRWRDGQKDSTIWGQSSDNRGIVPSYYDIDETTDIFSLDILHTLGKTALGGGLRYHRVRNDDSRYMEDDGDRNVQRDVYDTDLFGANLFSETRFNDRTLLSFGYSFTTLDSDVGGSAPDYPNSSRQFTGLTGGSENTNHVVNANFWWNPIDDLVIVPSVRAEFWDQSSSVIRTENLTNRYLDTSAYNWDKFTEELEVRYSGVRDLLMYGRVELSQTDGDMSRRLEEASSRRSTDTDIDMRKYILGANWYPFKGVSLAGQYYFRSYDQDFDHVVDNDDAQLQRHDNDTHDLNLRLTWRAASNLTLVSRYDYQQSKIENQAFSGLPNSTEVTDGITSAEITRHIFSQSVTWVPAEWVYLQGSFHWIDSLTDTPANELAPGVDSGFVPDWSNDYWMLSLNAGFALGDRTDLQAGYFYYDADNFVNNSDIGTPYGTLAKEHALTLRLTQRIRSNMAWNVGYGYYRSDDGAYGGNRDYDAHVVSTGFRYRF